MLRGALWLSAGTCVLILAAQTAAPPEAAQPAPKKFVPQPIEQPLPFSHKTHISVAKLDCKSCHEIPDPGDFAGIPATAKCMTCHAAIQKESPHIQRLAAWDQKKEPVPWKRVYRIADYVYFSHREHLASGKATCQTCHGPVQERDVLARERDITSMAACMDCHREHSAPLTCDYCHEQR
jgi:hypothetical protein